MGLLLLCNGSFMLIAGLVSGIYQDGATLDILLAAIVTMLVGVMAMFYTRGHRKEVKRVNKVKKKEQNLRVKITSP